MNHRLQLIKEAIKLYEQGNAPGDENLLVDFIEHQIKCIREGK